MPARYPIEYSIEPKEIQVGTTWLTISLKNIGTKDLSSLDVRLNSFDTYSITVLGTGTYIPLLAQGEERDIYVEVSGSQSTSVYVSIEGWEVDSPFFWESPLIPITVGQEAAELASLFAMVEPYPVVGDLIRCEAKVQGLASSPELELDFWADYNGNFEKLGEVRTKALSPGEEATYATEFTPEEDGLYTIYAYLYDSEGKRIDRETDKVYVT